jgi:hypothetical protein
VANQNKITEVKGGSPSPKRNGARSKTAEDRPLENFLHKDIKIADLRVIGTLGKGSFGHVQLVKDKKGKTCVPPPAASHGAGQHHTLTHDRYALKTVNKSQIVRLYAPLTQHYTALYSIA